MGIGDDICIILLHQNPQYLSQCAELLNKEWTRSFSARSQSLEQSFNCLPDSMLLVEEINGEKHVIGHSRLTRVLEDENGCWIKSVVISKDKRNKGYGKLLMKKTEEYAKSLNFSTAYLNTHDQQGFYEHLGYQYCDPVSSISFKHQGSMLRGIVNKVTNENCSTYISAGQHNGPHCDKNLEPPLKTDEQTVIRNIPPPPPLPQIKFVPRPPFQSNLGQYWLKKSL